MLSVSPEVGLSPRNTKFPPRMGLSSPRSGKAPGSACPLLRRPAGGKRGLLVALGAGRVPGVSVHQRDRILCWPEGGSITKSSSECLVFFFLNRRVPLRCIKLCLCGRESQSGCCPSLGTSAKVSAVTPEGTHCTCRERDPQEPWVCGVYNVPSTTLHEWGSSRQLGRRVISRGVGRGRGVQEPWSSLLQKMGFGKNMHMANTKCCS